MAAPLLELWLPCLAYDMDGDGSDMELVAGSTIYNNDGSVFCELGARVVPLGYSDGRICRSR